jgi:hypothetical protein
MIELLTGNWQYKIIALFFAVALYFYTSDLITLERTLRVAEFTAHDVRVPDGYVVTEVSPRALDIDISGPKSLVSALGEAVPLQLPIEEDELIVGRKMRFSVTPQLLGLNPKIRVDQVAPVPELSVLIERLASKTVSVSSQIAVQGLPDGLDYELRMEQVDLTVLGPEPLLERLEQIETRPVDLSTVPADLGEEITKAVTIQLVSPRDVRVQHEGFLEASIIIRPQLPQKNVQIPLQVAASPDLLKRFRVELSQGTATVPVRGPQALLDALNPEEQLRGLVQVSASWPLDEPQSVVVRVLGPTWFSYDTVQVKATLRLAESQAPEQAPAPPQRPEPDGGPIVPLE